jgi:hypothetical protein
MQYRTDDHSNDNLNSGDSIDPLDVLDSADFGKIEQTESIVHNQGQPILTAVILTHFRRRAFSMGKVVKINC